MEPGATKASIMIKATSSGADETIVSTAPPTSYDYMGQASYGANAVPWCLPDAPYPASAYLEEPSCDYFSLSRSPFAPIVGGNWQLSNNFSPEACFPTPLSSLGSRAGVWRSETEADYREHELFSPVSDLATVDMKDSETHAKRSWSEESSTSVGPQTNDKAKATSRPKGRGSKHNIQLRTASRKARKTNMASATPLSPAESVHNLQSPSDDDDLTPEERRARRNHNLVEKQYRNRLNAQFERLLAVLPLEQYKGSHLGQGNYDGFTTDEKRMSKAEVLDLATRRIKALEMERERLHRERKELLRNMDLMAGAVAQATNQGH